MTCDKSQLRFVLITAKSTPTPPSATHILLLDSKTSGLLLRARNVHHQCGSAATCTVRFSAMGGTWSHRTRFQKLSLAALEIGGVLLEEDQGGRAGTEAGSL
jgi:hypothetical protein